MTRTPSSSRAWQVAACAAALALALGACGGGSEGATTTTDEEAPAVEQEQAGSRDRVFEENFPDPHVIAVDGAFFAYATNGEGANLPVLRSADLRTWERVGDGMPALGSWATTGRTWAPEVLVTDDGRYVAYYTAAGTESGRQCIGRAVATDPAGPFVDDSPAPLVCQADEGGSIDASPFRDEDGSLYLLWKNDGNAVGADTWLYAQPLAPDGLSLTGEPVQLLRQDAAWEGDLVEAPFLWRHTDPATGSGQLFLFFSANDYGSADYAVGYARCEGPLGPCVKGEENPILTSAGEAAGPGHNSVVEADGKAWFVYHAWAPDSIGSTFPGRTMWISELVVEDGVPVVRGPA